MKLRGLIVAMIGLLALSGCQASVAQPGKLSVVVGLYPYAYLAEAIGGDRVAVTNLTKPGAEPHDLELTAQQIIAVATSNLTVFETGLQPAVDAAVANAGPANVLDVTTVVPLEERDKTPDPHIWLDPTKMITVARAIAAELTRIDPAGQSTYASGLAAVTTELTTLDQTYASGLATCQRQDFITTHAAFGYLAERYGLIQIAIAGISPDTDPSPARIADIQQIAREMGLTTVFFETLASPALADAIASDVGLKTAVLDPIEGITNQSAGTTYPEIMLSNLAALQRANGCS